ncbi:hypothetical protein PBI_SCTP2_4 [Salicola phage SCTP-2]|nr:hypothetical protein PBI_SCTP2_4 [Salicola phage SCTP-2]
MAQNYETTELHQLDQVYTIDNNTLLLVSKDGTEYKFTYEDLFRRIEQHLNEDTFTIHSNAKYFDGIPVKSDGTEQNTVMMYREDINSYVPKLVAPTHIDWSDSITGEGWLRINSLNELESDQIKVSDIHPSSNYSDYENRFLILRVSDNGEFIYEYDLDVSDFITQPQDNVDDLNNLVGDQYKVGNITKNRPNNDDGYLLNLKSDDYDSQSQLFLSTDSNKIRYRYHDTNEFKDWVTIYNNSENPLSDSIQNTSSNHIATSKAVNTLKTNLDNFKNLLTPNYLLNEIIKVDGINSKLNADKLDDLEGSEYATMFETTNISKLPENSIRFNHNSNIFEKKYNGEWNNLNIDGSNITTAKVDSKGTVKFSNEQQSINGDDSVATTPESVYTIIQKYGLSVNSDPGEEITDADIAFTTGIYRLPSQSSGNPYTNSCSLIVYRPGVNNWVHQIAYRGDSKKSSIRSYNGFSWSDWSEYINTDITGTVGLKLIKSETKEQARLNIGLDVGQTGFDLIESETPNDGRNALKISEDDNVEFNNVTINGNDVFHKGIMTITDTRTSTTDGDVLSAKGMHDHINSADHDSRYYTQDEVDKLIAEATGTPTGGIIMWSGLINNIPAGWALCVTGDTFVTLEDGSKKEIKEIVENKEKVNVLSYNEYNGLIESKPIIDWFCNDVEDNSVWRELIVESVIDEISINLTNNHPIWVHNKGWVEAKDLVEDDTIINYNINNSNGMFYKLKVKSNKLINDVDQSQMNLSKFKKRYDIKVKDNRSFIANDIIVHNCDGSNGTPDLTDRFIVGAGGNYSENDTGGSKDAVVVEHTHDGSTTEGGSHSHTGSTDSKGDHTHGYRDGYFIESYKGGDDGNEFRPGDNYPGPPHKDTDNNFIWYKNRVTNSAGNHNHSLNVDNGGAHSHNLNTNSTGENGTDKNLPPYYALAFIMKL